MTQLEKSVFGAGFVAMTEDELYEVNGGRIGGRGANGYHHPSDANGGSKGSGVSKETDKGQSFIDRVSKVTLSETKSTDNYVTKNNDGSTTVGRKTETTKTVVIEFK